jgi:hypothetical protein
VTSTTKPFDDPAFKELCRQLRVPPRQRTLADYIQIGKLIGRMGKLMGAIEPVEGRGKDPRRPDSRTRWAEPLCEELHDHGISLSPTMVYRYRRLAAYPDRAFVRACRTAERARWEDVMRLLPIEDSSLRLELLDVAEGREEGDGLSARAFKEVVRLADHLGAMPGRPRKAARRPVPADAARRLRRKARSAETEAATWFAGTVPLTVGIGNVPGLDAAVAGEARAALRLFRAAARRLDRALEPLESAPPRRPGGR